MMSPWTYLWRLYKPRSNWLGLAFLCLAITWLSAAALLAISGWFITACALAGAGLIVGLDIFTPSALIRALAILRTLGRYAERVIGHEAILRILADLRVRAFSAVARQPAKRQDDRRHVDLVNRLTADVDTLDGVPIRIMGPLSAAILTWLSVLAIAFHWGGMSLAATVGAGGALTFMTAAWCAKAGRRLGTQLIQARRAQRVALGDYLGGLAELTAYRRIDAWQIELGKLDTQQCERHARQERIASISEHAVQALTALLSLLVVLQAWPSHAPTTVALLTLMTLGLNEALGMLPGAFWRMGESEQAARHLMALESNTVDTNDRIATRSASGASIQQATNSPTIRIDSLIGKRQTGERKPLNITLHTGVPLVIHGRSASGKTSLLATLAGELEPVQGHVWEGVTDLLELPDHERYRCISFMSQNDQLLDVSIGEFLSLGRPTVDEPAMRRALHAVDLLDVLDQTDEGLDYRLGVGGSRISGGQARRLQLAAIYLRSPALLLLDEPFRGLQPALVRTMLHRLQPWISERCCVIVTHDPNALPEQWPRLGWPQS